MTNFNIGKYRETAPAFFRRNAYEVEIDTAQDENTELFSFDLGSGVFEYDE